MGANSSESLPVMMNISIMVFAIVWVNSVLNSTISNIIIETGYLNK